MSTNKKSYKQYFHFPLLILGVLSVFLVLTLFLYKERYFQCINIDKKMCLTSKKYLSKDNRFIFRYPKDYPITFKTGKQMHEEYGFDEGKYLEFINFSSRFYPNAGGDRLAAIIVDKADKVKDISAYRESILSEFNKLPERYKSNPPKVEIITINNNEFLHKSIGYQPFSFTVPEERYTFFHNGKKFILSFYYNSYYHKLPTSYYEKGRSLILNTFSFTNWSFATDYNNIMKLLVVYDSQFGNTRKIAEVIAETIRGKAVKVSDFKKEMLNKERNW